MKTQKGFTLVELLIVVAIIAILAAIGAAVFGNFQKSARDAARKSDITTISQVMEANYGGYGQTNYAGLATNFFASGAYPADPSGGNSCGTGGTQACAYCVRTGSGVGNCASGYTPIGNLQPASGSSYLVCVNLESASGGSTYYCQQNQRQ